MNGDPVKYHEETGLGFKLNVIPTDFGELGVYFQDDAEYPVLCRIDDYNLIKMPHLTTNQIEGKIAELGQQVIRRTVKKKVLKDKHFKAGSNVTGTVIRLYDPTSDSTTEQIGDEGMACIYDGRTEYLRVPVKLLKKL